MAMNYRPIKPAPLMDGSHRIDKSTRSAPKRPPPTKTACWGCRKRKAKCDGQRPACANCIKINKRMRLRYQDERFKYKGSSARQPRAPRTAGCFKSASQTAGVRCSGSSRSYSGLFGGQQAASGDYSSVED
ncbi:hypothetical protein CEP52_007737 [Fusarium oligoseptatum]|uniref:Zn(2)-C6 fungal-type domain-containing protein n=1 Tax=Fusarium oligoseptatum TaxID=2604345 RepID=A0A428TLD4_9HYPO|nr:hypothetical protein CEP52_007737 [Fusarium oligoseptatum]